MKKQFTDGGEAWSAERIKELTMSKIHSKVNNEYRRNTSRRIIPRFATVAAVLILTLSLATAALAATGVLGNIFAVFTGGTVNGGLGNDSRKAIVNNDFVETVTNVSASNDALALNAYYADEREFGFDFTLSGTDIEDGFYSMFVPNSTLEITDADGKTSVWESKFEEPSDITVNTAAVKTENGYDVSLIVRFYKGNVPVGKTAKLTVENIEFHYPVQSPDLSAPDRVIVVTGEWSFDVDIANKFANVTALAYTAANNSVDGVTILSVSVLPSVCRIEAEIDYSQNTLANPETVKLASEPKYVPKMQVFDTRVNATDANGKTYRSQSSDYYPDEPLGGATKCWFEIDSMFFDAPETLTLTFTGYNGTTIDVPLSIVR